MQQPNIVEEKQEINADNSPGLQPQSNEQKEPSKQYFTTKCKWISFSVSFFVLAGIGIFLGVFLTQKNNSAPTLKLFQRDEFQQTDEICMYHTSQKLQNCTQIQMKTERLVNQVNEKNTSGMVLLKGLKIRTFNQNADGTREYNEMVDQNLEIEQQIKKLLRILQQSQSTQNDNLCEGIPAEECGNVNQVPLVTVVTDSQTGAIQSIGIPAEIPDLMLQPLVSNIIHIAPNVAESINNTSVDGGRILKEDYSNAYYIGKEVFIPKTTKTKSWFGNTVIKKTISLSDQIDGSSKGINLFDMFEQSQETSLDNNNYLISSHITTNSKYSNSIETTDSNQNSDDLTSKSETEITNDSNLITVETKSDEELTNTLSEIQNKQTIKYYSIQDLQDKIQGQKDQTPDLTQDQDLQGGNRLLQDENKNGNENVDNNIASRSIDQNVAGNQQEGCTSNIFNQKIILKEAKVLKQKVGLQVDFKGEVKDGSASGYLKSCVSLNDGCLVDLYKRDFYFQGKPFQNFEKKGSQRNTIFSTVILIMAYPLTVGADYSYNWGFIESALKTESDFGISEYIYASLSISAYGEINLAILKIRAGVEGFIFKGSAYGIAQFRINQIDKVIIPQKYMVYLDFQIEALTLDLYAQHQYPTISWGRRCIKIFRRRICFPYPIFGWSGWKDLYRQNLLATAMQARKRIFELTSKCY